jgi:ATP/maltotriose-dependent transcriptional regulator MalT
VWTAASPEERRSAHRALAEANAGDAVARTWHLAEAATGPDDDLANELVAVAAEARRRQGFAAATAATVRAASLVTDAEHSTALLAGAVNDAFMSGDIDLTRALAARVMQGRAAESSRGEALYALGLTEQYSGSVPAARELLREAGELTQGRMRIWSLAELAITQHRLSDVVGLQQTAARMAEHGDQDDPEQRALAGWVSGLASILSGEFEPGLVALSEALDLLDSDPSLRDDPRFLCYAILGHAFVGDAVEAFAALERRIQVARERGALGVLVPALALTANGRASLLGDHVGAFADAGEAVELAQHLQYVVDAAPAMELLAWEYAARGQHDEAQRELDRARDLLVRAGTTEYAAHFAETAAFCALSRGDLQGVVDVLEARVALDGGLGSMGEPLGVAPLLVEAYVGLGRGSDARALAARYADATVSPMPATQALVARCAGLAAESAGESDKQFERALEAHALAPDRFEVPHTRLLYGARLRRTGRRKEAREHLRAAAGDFAAMDLTAWARRAEDELNATGESARPRQPFAQEPLTSQETRVALLAAQGLSNREIASALFLSPKTIEHHLSSVYRKRGLRSRAQLAHAFHAATMQ